jgi:hypothetical protein
MPQNSLLTCPAGLGRDLHRAAAAAQRGLQWPLCLGRIMGLFRGLHVLWAVCLLAADAA